MKHSASGTYELLLRTASLDHGSDGSSTFDRCLK